MRIRFIAAFILATLSTSVKAEDAWYPFLITTDNAFFATELHTLTSEYFWLITFHPNSNNARNSPYYSKEKLHYNCEDKTSQTYEIFSYNWDNSLIRSYNYSGMLETESAPPGSIMANILDEICALKIDPTYKSEQSTHTFNDFEGLKHVAKAFANPDN